MKKKILTLIGIFVLALSLLTSCEFSFDSLFCEHEFTEEIVKPTCETRGYTIKTCQICNCKKKTDYVSPLGHTFDDEVISPTCLAGGYTIHTCTVCGKVRKDSYTDPAGHSFTTSNVVESNGKYYLESKCDNCTEVKSNEISHDYTKLYGYRDLVTSSNNGYLQFYYDILVACNNYSKLATDLMPTEVNVGGTVKDYYVIAELDFNKYGLSKEEAVTVWKVFGLDNPQYYWLSKEILYSNSELSIISEEEYALYSNRSNANTLLDKYVLGLNSLINNSMTEYQIAKTIHDYIAGSCKYAYVDGTTTIIDADWAHSLIGIVEKGKVVCEGYSKMYTYLSSIYGLECFTVLGSSEGVGHAWNYVNINDKYYPVDLTWDDSGKTISYDYFLISAYEFSKKHTPYSTGNLGVDYLYKLPELSTFGYGLV